MGLERLAEAFRVLLWEQTKALGLSPIQIQVLIFLAHHAEEYRNVSHLAREFNLSKATISDVVAALSKKALIEKVKSHPDQRRYSIQLSAKGRKVLPQAEGFSKPLVKILDQFAGEEKRELFRLISKLIFQLNQSDVLTIQRMCYSCKFYEKSSERHYCHYLKKPLRNPDLRLDCPEFEPQKEA